MFSLNGDRQQFEKFSGASDFTNPNHQSTFSTRERERERETIPECDGQMNGFAVAISRCEARPCMGMHGTGMLTRDNKKLS